MSNNFKYSFGLLVLIIWNSILFSQNTVNELKKVRNAYLVNQNLSFDVSAYSFRTKTDKNPTLISKGHVKKTKDNYYSKFLDYELLVIGEKALMIDNFDKTLSFYEYKNQSNSISKDFQINVDSIILSSDSITMLPIKNGVKQFIIYDKSNDILRTEIFVDDKTNFINRILFYYTPSNEEFESYYDRVDVYYKNIKTDVVVASDFRFEKYFTKIKGRFSNTIQYQKYKFNYYNSRS
jgi:hypothetical protein